MIMTHDSNQATLTLKDDTPVLEFQGVGQSERLERLNQVLQPATQAFGRTFVAKPFHTVPGQQEITLHPIGGACLARDGTGATGVTNHCGEVFTGSGSETYPRLVVTDGDVVPLALKVNPFATITALAERSVEYAAKNLGATIDFDTKNWLIDLFGEPQFLI
jgi:hypothetical protein